MRTIIFGHTSTLHWLWTDAVSLDGYDLSAIDITDICLFSNNSKIAISDYSIYYNTIDIPIPSTLPVGVYSISARYYIGTEQKVVSISKNNIFQVTRNSDVSNAEDIYINSDALSEKASSYTRTIYVTAERFLSLIESDSILENALYVVNYGNGDIRTYIGKESTSVQTNDSLTSSSTLEALSANMGRVLNERIGQEKKHQATINEELKRLIDAKVMEVGAVPFDTRPREGSTNPVTSEGILQFHRENHVVLTEEEFETLEKAGALVDGVFYYTYEENE